VQNDPAQLKCGFRQLSRSLVVGHYVVGEILLRHMSSKPVSRELHGPLRRFADYSDECLRTRPKTAKKRRTLTLRRCYVNYARKCLS
jgi:hypothetical protein